MITKQQLHLIMPAATEELVDRYFDAIIAQCSAVGVISPLRLAHYLAQISHETGDMHAVSENLNYSAESLIRTWPTRFNQGNAAAYAHQPAMIANLAYGGRYGNGPQATGDGWRYRGRGFLQLTFKGNYNAFEKSTGIDVVSNPDLIVTDPQVCVQTSTHFWSSHNLNLIADRDDLKALRKIVNGGAIGLDDCAKRLVNAKKVLGI